MVPVEWLIGAIATLAAVMAWGLKYFITRNDTDHRSLFRQLRRLDRQLLHIIQHHNPRMPPFQDSEDEP